MTSFLRFLKIYFIVSLYGLDSVVLNTPLFRRIRFLKYCNPLYLVHRQQSRGIRIRLAIEKLGPIFIKFGQILSTRPDMLPDDIVTELAKLRDQVPPFPGKQAVAIIEKNFNAKINTVYKTFSEIALASASVAQVHSASLHTGEEVVVKIIRPGIGKRIKKDIDLLKLLAKLIQKYYSEGERLKPLEVVYEFEKTLENELDLLREAANATQLKRNFDHSNLLYIPTVYWEYCKRSILTIEKIHGIPVDNLEKLREQNIDLKKLSERGVEIFFTQVFRDNFFHADMHPGNIFVSFEHPENPKYLGVDFGIMGSLSENDKRYLAENFLAFFNRDYRRVAKLHLESHWVPSDTRVEEFESAIRTVCEPIFQKSLKDISFGQLLVRLFQTARRFKMPIQPQLVLLEKTLLNVEGLGRQLNPDLDLWKTAKPFLEKWIKTQVGPRAFLRKLKQQAPYWLEKLPELPRLIESALEVKNKPFVFKEIQKPTKHRSFFLLGATFGLLFASVFLSIFKVKLFSVMIPVLLGVAMLTLLASLI